MQDPLGNPPFLSVVIPAYNEAKRLPATLEKVIHFLSQKEYPSEIIVVDDGSEDDTAEKVEKFLSMHPQISIIRNPHWGKGAAVKTGMLKAQGKFVLFSDADLSTPIEAVDGFLPWLEKGYDVVIGSREGKESRRYNEPYHRHLMGRIFNFLVKLLAVKGIEDTQCGFKAFTHKAAQDLFARALLYAKNKKIKGNMVTAFDVEILFLAKKLDYSIKEIPIRWHYYNETKVHAVRDSWRNFKDVLKVRWNAILGKYD